MRRCVVVCSAGPLVAVFMSCFLAGFLRCVAGVLVPCGIIATLVLPRAYGEAGHGAPHHGADYSALLVAEGLPFIIIRPNGRIAMASRSARRLFALRAGSCGNLLSLTAGTEAQEAIRRALSSPFERTEYFRVAFPGTEGEERLYRMESAPMSEGNATGIVLRELSRSAEETHPGVDARMAEAATSMAGPLSVLSGWLETAHEPGASLTPSALRAMERQVARLRELSAGLEAEASESSLLLGSFELAPVVQRAADQLAPRMVETGSRLELSYGESPFMLRGEPTLWRQIVGELLASTLHEPVARQLRLTAEHCGQQVVVTIASDGPAFWDEAPEGGRSHLELVRAAVRAQHGELEDEATAPHGTRYRLIFPV